MEFIPGIPSLWAVPVHQPQASSIIFNNTSLNLSSHAKEPKAKISKQGPIKLRSFCRGKENTDKTKRQPTKWKKKFSNYMIDELILKNILTPHKIQYKTQTT